MVGLENYGWRRSAAGLVLLAVAVLAGIASHSTTPVQAAPVNDNLANASPILFQPYTILSTTAGATEEGSEMTSFSTCTGVFPSTTIGQSIWYKWTAPANTTILADTIGSSSNSEIAVYSGPASSPTFGGLALVGCSSSEFSSNNAGVSFSATSGTTYYFQVGGFFNNEGPVILNLGIAPATIGTTFIVDNGGDGVDVTVGNGTCNGPGSAPNCTLRAAVMESNAMAGPNFIRFAIGSGPVTITAASPIAITSPINIDARTQPGFVITPVVQLSGPSTGNGLEISTAAATLRGFVINSFSNRAIDATSSGNVIQGNYIGTNSAGSAASSPVNAVGVFLGATSSNNAIGGITDAARNVISGNTGQAVYIEAGSGNQVMGNYIGTDAFGFASIPNGSLSGRGAVQLNGADNSTIGGTIAGSGNLISGNSKYGIGIFELSGAPANPANANVVQGNRIGTDVNASAGVPNAQGGIFIGGGTNSTVGGSSAAANTVAFNGGPGIAVSLDGDPSHVSASAAGNKLSQNSIHDNTGLGIDLNADGVTANDAGDADTGPNNRQNFPILTGTFAGGGSSAVKGTLNSTASTSFTIEYFSNATCDGPVNGEGATFLASVTTTTDGTGNVSFTNTGLPPVSVGTIITATATRNSAPLDTSEFSVCSTVCADDDVDQVCNTSDNCPNWANSAQALPTWPVPAGDADCDGFPDSVAVGGKAAETYIGTDPLQHCAATAGANNDPDPDAWPVDFNDDQAVNGQDVGKYGGPYGAGNHLVSQGPFGPPGQEIAGIRFDLSGDGAINGQDTGKFQAFYNKTCL